MGNSSSSSRGQHEDTVDFGHLVPQVFTGQRDWNQSIAVQAICERRLAPFYRPLEDYDESWDEDQIMAARKEPPAPAEGEEGGSNGHGAGGGRQAEPASHTSRSHHKRTSNAGKEPSRHPEAAIYRGAVECPICFLYYPPNINYSRCCEQPICTECFVQIKRAEPTPQHLESEPAACPYCVQDNFGVVYTPPRWRAGIGSEGGLPPSPTMQASAGNPPPRRRRKSFGANDPDVVTIDYIRPDWEAKLAAVKAAVARRANRRIIMRQVGDRLIPVGVTSGRIQLLPDGADGQGGEGEGNGGGGGSGSRRSRRRHQQNQDLGQFLGQMGMGGQDLEELMIMEAMRLSLVDEEDRQRKEKEKQAKEEAEKAKGGPGSSSTADNNGASTSAQDGPSNRPSVDRSAPASSSSLSPSSGLGQSGTPPSRSRTSLDVPGSDRDPVGGHRRSMSRNRSPSPAFSALGAALKSAASTASALVGSNGQGSGTSSGHQTPKASAAASTPSPKQEQPASSVAAAMSSPVGPGSSTSVFITPDVSNEESVPGAWGDEVAMALAPITSSSPGAGASSSAPGQSVNVNGEAQHAEGSHPVPIPAANTVPQSTEASFADKRPDVLHLESFASSVAPNEADAYEALDSSPESTRSREPLLDSEAPVAGQPGSSQA